MAQQRYTPVPGMGPPGGVQMSQVGNRGSGYGDENYLYEEGSIPAAHRFSYNDSFSRPQSQSFPMNDPLPRHSRMDSSASSVKYPLAAGAGAFAGAAAADTSDQNMAYQNIPSEQYWAEPAGDRPRGYAPNQSGSRFTRKWKIAAIVVGVITVIAIVVGVVVSQVIKSKSNGSSSGSSNSADGSNGVLKGDDPSVFDKDSNLHQSFWAMAYTPQGAILPDCNVQLANVTRDIQILSQLTTRMRLYGANCNQTAIVLQAIKDTKVDMTIWPAVYVDSNTQAYTDQVSAVEDAIKTYGTDHIEGIIIGNEYILNTAGTESLTSATYLSAVRTITDNIQGVNSTIQALGLSKHLPIGTSDAGSLLSTTLATGIDFFMANVHPWFATVGVDIAAAWTDQFFHDFDVDVAATAPNNPNCYIAETGWPSNTSNATEGNNGAASPGGDASLANLQTFLDTFVCQANANGTEYFFFEAFDEPWKEIYGGVEPHWGLFDSERNLKSITIPTC